MKQIRRHQAVHWALRLSTLFVMSTFAATPIAIASGTVAAAANTHDHEYTPWASLLKRYVTMHNQGQKSTVDYKSFTQPSVRKKLDDMISSWLKQPKSTVDAWSVDQQRAFYFNLYNALTIQLIVKEGPVKSIKDLGSGIPFFQSPWKKKFFHIFGKPAHLDEIEHELVRGNPKLFDARVHFAFNCASIGCPALLNEAFVATRLQSQMDSAEKNFLMDRDRNRLNGNTLELSSIFRWYRSDFERDPYTGLKQYVMQHVDYLTNSPSERKVIEHGDFEIDFLDYDWRLNNSI